MTKTIQYGKEQGQSIVFNTRNISIIGGNGSGKSSLMRKLNQLNPNYTIISAHKNLVIQQGQYRAQDENWLDNNKSRFRNPKTGDVRAPSDNNSVQDDFNQIIEIVFRDYTDASVTALNSDKKLSEISRKLDVIFDAWNSIFIDKKLLYKDKRIQVQVVGEDNYYDIENLSDGERGALYILIKIIIADSGSTIIIDEPETFLNASVLNQLFDQCEKIKNESNFIYFSHDLEFVTTRRDNSIFWIKEYRYPDHWVILSTDPDSVPEELIVKIVGAKQQKILFVESEDNKDAKLYQSIYPDFKVWPVGSCENVINYTKAFNSRTEKFNKQYFGLIDRDLRTDEQVVALEHCKIFCLPTALYESLFLNKKIIGFVFAYLGRNDFEDSFSKLETAVKRGVNVNNFKLGYKKVKINQLFNQVIDEIAKGEMTLTPDFSAYDLEIGALALASYEDILKSFNQKNLKSHVAELGMNWSAWQNQVINIFSTEKANELREEFLKFMPDIS